MKDLKETISDVVVSHCDGGYIESTIDFINDLHNAVKESKQIDFEYCQLTKSEKDELILGAIDNVQNPKRDVTWEQACWLRFSSYIRNKGWKLIKR